MPAANSVFAAGGVDVRFESAVLFIYFITWEKVQVLTPRPTANTGRWQSFNEKDSHHIHHIKFTCFMRTR